MQAQLSQAIAEIGQHDFTAGNWPELLPHMVAQFQSGDFHMINGVLKTVHPLFERYRHAEKVCDVYTSVYPHDIHLFDLLYLKESQCAPPYTVQALGL